MREPRERARFASRAFEIGRTRDTDRYQFDRAWLSRIERVFRFPNRALTAFAERLAKDVAIDATARSELLQGQRRPLKPIICCTTASLCSAMSSCSRAVSAQSSQSFLVLPCTLTLTSSSTSSPQPLQIG